MVNKQKFQTWAERRANTLNKVYESKRGAAGIQIGSWALSWIVRLVLKRMFPLITFLPFIAMIMQSMLMMSIDVFRKYYKSSTQHQECA